MSCLIGRLPGRTAIKEIFQFAQVVHTETMEVAPARYAEQVVDYYGGVAFAGKALCPAELFDSSFGFVSVVVSVQ